MIAAVLSGKFGRFAFYAVIVVRGAYLIQPHASGTTRDNTTDRPVYTRPASAVNLIKDIENCVKAQQNTGFERWQKIQNLKEAAKTLNFLTENNLLQYVDLKVFIAQRAKSTC